MKLRTIGLATFAVLWATMGAGCGDDERSSTTPTPTTPARTASTPTATGPTPTTTAPPPGGGEHGGGGGEEPVRVPATFTLRAGRLIPARVSLPPFLAVRISVRSLDSRSRTVTIHAEQRRYRLVVRPGGRVARTLPGQRAGTYPITVGGGGRAALVVGGEPGP